MIRWPCTGLGFTAALARAMACAMACAMAAPALAADPAERALNAARALEEVAAAVTRAQTERDQVTALAQAIQAYEDGLFVLRQGLRDAFLREADLARQFAAQSDEMTRILGLLMATERLDPDLALLHPSGALEAARAGQLTGDLAPAVGAQVAQLRADLDEMRALRRARQFGLLALEHGLEAAQDARLALSQAVSARGPVPRQGLDAAETIGQLARDSETLDDFAAELAQMGTSAGDVPVASFLAARGTLQMPVRGTLLRRFGQEDALGIARPGLVLATTPSALVTAPWSATVRYAGPLAGQGNAVILEPAEDFLLVLAGLGDLLAETGEILPIGAPIGTMPVADPENSAAGTRSETLYFEVRRGGYPIDPEPWFALTGTTEPG